MSNYQFWLAQPNTVRIKPLYPSRVEFVHLVGGVGVFSMVLPTIDLEAIKDAPDRRIEILRRPRGGATRREFYGFIQSWESKIDEGGKPELVLSGHDATGLLARRMVVDSAGQLYLALAAKAADDAMKDAVRDNITAATDTDRNLNIITVDPDLTAGTTITRDFISSSLLSTLQDLQAYTKENGAEVFWGMRPDGSNWTFETQVGQLGRDRSSTGSSPLIFGTSWRNVTNVSEITNYTNALSNVYSLGSGLDANQATQEVINTTLRNASIYGRREGSTYATSTDTAAALSDAGEEALTYSRPLRRIVMDLLDTPTTPYGTASGWNVGDKITTDINGRRRDAIIRSVRVVVERGRETIRGNVEVTE